MKILLVEPEFPIPPKSRNHHNFLPIGLLKLAAYYREQGHKVKLIRGNKTIEEIDKHNKLFIPDKILVTSLFTYWADYVKETVQQYKNLFPDAKIVVGGIYASLMPEHCSRYTGCDEVVEGIVKEAEKCLPAYDLITDTNPHPIDYRIIHASRGCIRNCDFCGVRKIEPDFDQKSSIKGEIKKRKIVFYDNNILANPHIEDILYELIDLKKEKKILWCESQSGFDGRVLKGKPYLGQMLKKAGFQSPRIAWDWGYSKFKEIKEQIDILVAGGYNYCDVYVFMLYNWDIPFEVMERKRIKCWEWKVQIADCRYRPLDQIYDRYNPMKEQTNKDYHIHTEAGWTDALVKQFRKNVRQQNICVRHRFPFFSKIYEKKRVKDEIMRVTKLKETKEEKIKYLQQIKADYWLPDEITYPDG
jgi:hypothetical protein